MYRFVAGFFFVLFSLQTAKAEVAPLRICIDNNNWLPFIYLEKEQAKGIHIEIISSALDSLNYQYQFLAVPWKRCLKGLEKGFYDAVATASFSESRTAYLYYPEDAKTNPRSEWRVSQVEYIVATPHKTQYSFDGDLSNIPKPIRVPRGYSIGLDLKSKNIEVDDSAINDLQNIKRLLRENNGSVVTLPSVIDWYNKSFSSKIHYSETPITSKSYFFAISRNGKLNKADNNIIWQRIADQRAQVLSEVSEQMHQDDNADSDVRVDDEGA
ncbi:MAG: transporter substrate-binding domain-containing protein [Gammaproteobacteria bacterium]|nr:transporter substrate-binding domain-containing protein [Gammaproteobacteria bacterium]